MLAVAQPYLSEVLIFRDAVLLFLIFSSAVTDLKNNKIYNMQTYPAMLCGLAIGFICAGLSGFVFSFIGLLVGGGLLIFFYIVGGVGAGDVKLLGAIGALKGTNFVIWTMFYTGLVGGAMALGIIIWKGTALQTFKNTMLFIRHPLRPLEDEGIENYQYLPYGLAISIGCAWAFLTL